MTVRREESGPRLHYQPVMEKIVNRLIKIKPAFICQVIVMPGQEIFVQIVPFKLDNRHAMNLGKFSNSFVIKIAKATPDTEPVEVAAVDWNTEQQRSGP